MVPNKFPTTETAHRLALIGEAPSADEEYAGEPFVGVSGRFLGAVMSKAGLALSCCFKGNISQHRPPENKISAFKWDGSEIQSGIAQLKLDLDKFKPNIIVCLGNVPLKAAKDVEKVHPLVPKLYKFKNAKWRGSLFSALFFNGRKCISTYHPAYVLRDYKTAPLFAFDLKRAVSEALNPTLVLPKRMLLTEPTYDQTIENLRALRTSKAPIALDIEGGVNTMSCISFATLPSLAFIVPFTRKDGSSYWTEQNECRIWRELALTLEDPNIPKCLQNSLYDTFVLQYSYGIRVRNVVDDTMLKHWSLYCELRKSLGVQTSIYTREPYYKFMRLQANDDLEPREKNED